MKKIWMMAAAVLGLAVACVKERRTETPAIEETVVTYIKADGNGDATKGSVSGTDASFSWNTGDKIAVYADGYKISDALDAAYDGAASATFAFSGSNAVTESARAHFAVFPSKLVFDSSDNLYTADVTEGSLKLNLPSTYTLEEVQDEVSPTPMIAVNAPDGELSFKALCPLLRITVVNIPKQTQRIEFDFNGKKVQGEFTLTDVEAGATAIETASTSGADAIITVTMADNTVWHDQLVVNLPVPAGSYGNVTITAFDALSGGHAVLKLRQAIKSGGWNPTRKSSRKLTAILPVFSVSSTKKVTFAPGNLQYQASTNTWRFAEHQYDRVGDNKGNTTTTGRETQADWIDLFGWGTSGWDNGNSYYQPWCISYDESSSIGNGYGPANGGNYRISLTGEYANADWGVYNEIGSYPANTWRTPIGDSATGSKPSEWYYLFSVRPDCRQKMSYAGVANFPGIIILPDDFTDPCTNSIDSGAFAPMRGWYQNQYFAGGGWEAMELAGAVFLPAEGCRIGTSINHFRNNGYYWTSTTSYTNDSAYCLEFLETTRTDGDINVSRYYGCSVRLVMDLN